MKKDLTKTSNISSKYQTVIPAEIRKAVGLHVHEELVWQVMQTGKEPALMVTKKPKRWGDYLYGLGKEIWKDMDTDEYIRNLRKEWKT